MYCDRIYDPLILALSKSDDLLMANLDWPYNIVGISQLCIMTVMFFSSTNNLPCH